MGLLLLKSALIFPVAAAVMMLSLTDEVIADPVQWPVGQGGNGHYYEAVAGGCTWEQAMDDAGASFWQGIQGRLATITSEAENAWIWENLGQPGQHRLGGVQPPGSPEPGGGWTWVTGEPWAYENWSANQPSNANGDESTLEFIGIIHGPGEWNDVPSGGLCLGYIVEFDPDAPLSSLFAEAADYETDAGAYAVAIAELNGDGFLDLACANLDAGNVSVLLGNGDGTFWAAGSFVVGDGPHGVAVGRLDGDTAADLAVFNRYDDTISVLLGNGDGTFQAAQPYSVGDEPLTGAIGDLNGDPYPDLAVPNHDSHDVSVLLGNGDGTFQDATHYPAGYEPSGVVIVDLDGNDAKDLATVNHSPADSLSVLLGNGDGTFQAPVGYPAAPWSRYIEAGDLDGDDAVDLVATSYGQDIVSVLLGNGDGTFQPYVPYVAGDGPHAVAIGDLDGDDTPDLAVVNKLSYDVSVLRGNGDGSFVPHSDYEVGEYPNTLAIGDLDGHGEDDLAVPNWGDDNVSVLLNLRPIEPIVLSVADVGNDEGRQVRLEWMRSGLDVAGTPEPIHYYGIYRRQDETVDRPEDRSTLSAASSPRGADARLDGWDLVALTPASEDYTYECVAPTLCDSTESGGICWSVFFVSAVTIDPLIHFDSVPDSGYSIDNLAPEPPPWLSGGFEPEFGDIRLTWGSSHAGDLDYYELHRGQGPDFIPSSGNRLYAGVDTSFVDASHGWDGSSHYKVAAVDRGGSRSEYAVASALSTGMPDALPSVSWVGQSQPNPFEPGETGTKISYAVAAPGGHVRIRVHNLSGNLVRLLVDEEQSPGARAVQWDGKDDSGRRVSSGVYFCRVEVPGLREHRKMVVLR